MKKLRNFAVSLLALCMLLALAACGTTAPEPTETTPGTVPSLGEDTQAATAVYIVTVTDENGTPIPGVIVQLCSDVCVLVPGDEKGQSLFTLEPADYKVTLAVIPQGFALAGETTEFTFPEGSTELTIVLSRVDG